MKANTSFAPRHGNAPPGLRSRTLWPVAAGVTALVGVAAIAPEQTRSREYVAAEAGQDTVTSNATGPSGGFAYERESFVYTPRQRDPFLPTDGSGTMGAITDGIRLMGIIHHDGTNLDVALLGNVRTDVVGAGSRDGGGPRQGTVRVRPGQTVGDMRLARVHADHVVLEATTADGVVRRTLRIPRTSPIPGAFRIPRTLPIPPANERSSS